MIYFGIHIEHDELSNKTLLISSTAQILIDKFTDASIFFFCKVDIGT